MSSEGFGWLAAQPLPQPHPRRRLEPSTFC
jgi:hypothetical protein